MKRAFRSLSLVLVLMLSITMLFGCGGKEVGYATVMRDPSNVGGELTFKYDDKNHVATFGGTGETVAYYEADAKLGRSAGCRVGLQVTAPEDVEDFTGAQVKIDDKTYKDNFFDGDRFFWIYPLVSKDRMEVKFYVKWNKDSKEQTYTVKIVEGTLFEKDNA